MSTYNGHRSWNAWNVSLWINNCETLYRTARHYAETYGLSRGADMLASDLEGQQTPDGARYNRTCIREALRGIL